MRFDKGGVVDLAQEEAKIEKLKSIEETSFLPRSISYNNSPFL